MTGQYLVELRRLVHRRILLVFGIFSVLVLVVVGLSIWAATGPEVRYYEHYDDQGFETTDPTYCPTSLVTSYREEVRMDAGGGDSYYYHDAPCPETSPTLIPEQTAVGGYPDLYSPWDGSIAYFTIGALVLLWLLAASMIGDEFRHGTVETALVAEPRRARLLALRFAAVLTVGVGAYLLAVIGFLVANVPAWMTNGIDGTSVDPVAVLSAVGRGTLAVALVVLLSASLAVIGRGTLLSLGVLVGLTVVTAALFLFVRALVPVELFTNLFGLVTGGNGMRAYQIDDFGPRTVFGRGWPWFATLVVVALYTAAAVAGAFVTFARRDIR